MTYSIIGILAAIILLIINRDVLWPKDKNALTATQKNYRGFLTGVMCYYITDLLWGILESRRMTGILYADTAIHFVAMAAAVMLWTRYVVSYLDDKNRFGIIIGKKSRKISAESFFLGAYSFKKSLIGGYYLIMLTKHDQRHTYIVYCALIVPEKLS